MHYQPNGTRRMGVLRDKRADVEERGGVEGRCNLERGCITLFGRRSRGTNCLPSAVCSLPSEAWDLEGGSGRREAAVTAVLQCGTLGELEALRTYNTVELEAPRRLTRRAAQHFTSN